MRLMRGLRCAPLALVSAYLGFIPLLTLFAAPWSDHDAERVAQLVIMAIIGVCAATSSLFFHGAIALRMQVVRVSITAGVLVIDSVAMAAMVGPALVELSVLVGLGVCAFALANERDVTSAFAWGVIIAIGPYLTLVFALYLAVMSSGDALLRSEFFPGYSNFRFFNHIQTIAIPLLAVVSSVVLLPSWARRFSLGLLAFSFALLFFTAGRGTSAGLLSGVLLAAVACGQAGRPWIRRLAIIAAAGALLYGVLFLLLPAMLNVRTEMSSAELAANARSINLRFYLWRLALDYVAESPWFGIGPMHFAHRPNAEAAHPHNLPLQIAAEWGVPMLLLVLALTAYGLLRMLRAIRNESDPQQAMIGTGLWAACIAVAVDSCFSGNFVMPMPQMWIVFLLGWSIAWTRARKTNDRPIATITVPRAVTVALAAAALASQVWLLWSVRDQVRDLGGYLEHVRATIVRNDHDSPRFWSHGWF